MLKKLNFFIESKRVHGKHPWQSLVSFKDALYFPVHYLCMSQLFRHFFFKKFGTTGGYEPANRGIISHKYKFIFLYIPKVASTSIKTALAQILFNRDIHDRIHTFYFDEVIDLRKGDYPDYFKFSFVRNPWDRLVSCYSDKILHQSVTNYEFKDGVFRRFRNRYNTLFYKGMTFDAFVEVISQIPDEIAERHFRSQYTYHTDRFGNELNNFTGKFESLSSDLKHLIQKNSLPVINLSINNKSVREKNYRTFYTEKTRQLVASRYAKDIELYGYDF